MSIYKKPRTVLISLILVLSLAIGGITLFIADSTATLKIQNKMLVDSYENTNSTGLTVLNWNIHPLCIASDD